MANLSAGSSWSQEQEQDGRCPTACQRETSFISAGAAKEMMWKCGCLGPAPRGSLPENEAPAPSPPKSREMVRGTRALNQAVPEANTPQCYRDMNP